MWEQEKKFGEWLRERERERENKTKREMRLKRNYKIKGKRDRNTWGKNWEGEL